MKDPFRTNQELIEEISALKQRIQEMELVKSDLQRAEIVLQEKEERYCSLIDAISQSNIGLLVIDAGHRVRFMNQLLVAEFGDQTGRICYEGVGKANSPCDYCRLDEVIHQQRIVGYQPTTATGKIYDIVAVPFQDTDGTTCKLEVIQDITARKRTEDALCQSESRILLLADVLEHSSQPFAVGFPDGRLGIMNRAFCALTGYREQELRSMDWASDLTPKEWQEQEAQMLAKLEQSEEVVRYEKEYIRKDGTRVPIELLVHRQMGETGTVEYYCAFVTDITERKQIDAERRQSVERMRKALAGTVQAISLAVETRDPYTSGHQRRTADLARAIATEMGFPRDRIEFVRIATAIHDIGKISIPADILSKPKKMNDIEFKIIQSHAQAGYEILRDIEFPWPVAEVILQHHERMDGSGYPHGLKGGGILPEARILMVTDVVEAMASHRPYRPALGIDAAIEEISRNRGILYDPEVVDACRRLIQDKGYRLL